MAALAAAALGSAAKQALALPPAEAAPVQRSPINASPLVPAPEFVEPELPAETPPPEPPEVADDVRYRADTIRYDTLSRVVHLEGHVVIERGKGRLYAPRGTLDRGAGKLRLEGGVLAI